jgi:hypothetical protein
MSFPLVSIVTPTFNQASYVRACVESVLAQSYPHWEQIVVDDGSTDGTPDVVESYGDPRVRCVRLPHRGLAALGETYNTALRHARGDLVAILEGDDCWPSDKLERQIPAFDDPSVFLSWGRGALIDETGHVFQETATVRTREPKVRIAGADLFARLTRTNAVAPAITTMVRRGPLEAMGGFRQTGSSLFVDLPTWLWLTATTPGSACFVNAVLGLYRVHGQQTTRLFKARMDSEHLDVVLEVTRQLDAAALRALGWDAAMERRARLSGALAKGVAQVNAGEYRAARRTFAGSFAAADTLRDRAKAGIGLASALLRTDLLTSAYSLGDRVAASVTARRARRGAGPEPREGASGTSAS